MTWVIPPRLLYINPNFTVRPSHGGAGECAQNLRIIIFLIAGAVEPWAQKEAGGTLIEANFQEGEILTLSKWDKLYVIPALLEATSLMVCSIYASEFLIFQPLLEVGYVGVRFLHVSNHFHLFRRHKIDVFFKFSHREAQPSTNGSMRYMMWISDRKSVV